MWPGSQCHSETATIDRRHRGHRQLQLSYPCTATHQATVDLNAAKTTGHSIFSLWLDYCNSLLYMARWRAGGAELSGESSVFCQRHSVSPSAPLVASSITDYQYKLAVITFKDTFLWHSVLLVKPYPWLYTVHTRPRTSSDNYWWPFGPVTRPLFL